MAGGVRGHLASSNDATLPNPAGPRKRKVRVGRKIIAALSPGGRVLPATSRQGSCPTHRHRPRHLHLADHGPASTGSNRPLSRLAVTQARTKSPALGERTPPTGNQPLASQAYLAKECLGKGMIGIRACSIPLPHHSSAILLLTERLSAPTGATEWIME